MSPTLSSRLPVAVARIVVMLAFLPWMGGFQHEAPPTPVRAPAGGGLPAGWTAGEWDQVVRMVQADLSGSPARLAGTWDQRTKLAAADAQNMVDFGWSVAVDGDTLVVGAINDRVWVTSQNRYYYCGSVYVFRRHTLGWSVVHQVAKLVPDDPIYAEYFGFSVAIDGNYIVVGAPDTNKAWAGSPGAAYLFMNTAEGWKQIKKLTELTHYSGTTPPRFGYSVDIDGDLIVIGAPNEDLLYDGTLHKQQGSVYVFQIPGASWPGAEANENGILTPTDGRAEDMFGSAVAVNGHTVVVGAYGYEPDPNNPAEIAYGKAYIFSQSDPWGNSNDVARFTASDAGDSEYFGWDVAIDGDLAVIGAPGDYSMDANGQESVYLFERPVGGWSGNYTETARLAASDDHMFHDLGNSVAVSGDVVVAGAPSWDTAGSYEKTGAVYVFAKPAGGWVDGMHETQRLLANDHAAGDQFGRAVAIDGTAIAVGDYLDNGSYGSVYLFDSTAEPWLRLYLPLIVR